jgi:hypothetical protein
MIRTSIRLSIYFLLMCCTLPLLAQSVASADSVVPGLVKFTGTLNDTNGKPLTGTVGVTFSLYTEQSGGAPLWMETQNVQADKTGHYSIMLGSATSHGIPAKTFSAGEARWLGVQPTGQDEQPRVMLASVPYSMKALDAETLGGKPLSAFQLATPQSNQSKNGGGQQTQPPADQKFEIRCASGSACKTSFVPLFSSNGGSSTVHNSIIKQTGSNIAVAGGQSVTGDLSSGGNITATGSVTATDISASNSISTDGFVSATQMAASSSANGNGFVVVAGDALASGDVGITGGVYGQSNSDTGRGIWGRGTGANSTGVYGEVIGSGGIAVLGEAGGVSGQGVIGESFASQISGNGFGPDGVDGISHSPLGAGVAAVNTAAGDGLFAQSNGGFAAFFLGDVDVDGNLSKAGGSFKIDHPLDPANKYLYHSFVESPDMMNIYNGTVTTDAQGNAIVVMPDWFEALNRDFRYQLTVIGQFAQAIVASKMVDHRFSIKTDKPNVEVSWQVTGVRHDAWADAHRIPVEVLKTGRDRGLYLHPELFGASAEKSIATARHPMKRTIEKVEPRRSIN